MAPPRRARTLVVAHQPARCQGLSIGGLDNADQDAAVPWPEAMLGPLPDSPDRLVPDDVIRDLRLRKGTWK